MLVVFGWSVGWHGSVFPCLSHDAVPMRSPKQPKKPRRAFLRPAWRHSPPHRESPEGPLGESAPWPDRSPKTAPHAVVLPGSPPVSDVSGRADRFAGPFAVRLTLSTIFRIPAAVAFWFH